MSVSGSIITVKFEIISNFTLPQVTIPLFGPEYIRYPIKAGDKGVVFPCDVKLGGMSGLGSGVADLTSPPNLTALVFFPIGNTAWSAVDANQVTLYGPNGVTFKDTANNSSVILLPASVTIHGQNSVTITSGGVTLSLSSSGAWSLSGNGAGTLHADSSVTISDSVHSTNLSQMNSVFASLVTFINGHIHNDPQGGTTSAPTTTFTGNIVS